MEIAQLKILLAVVRQKNFSAVARQRNVSPSSISRSITAIEQELGVRLLQRTTRNVVLTEAGLRYVERIESLVDELDLAKEAIQENAQLPRGTLRITASPSFGTVYIAPLLSEFSNQYPDLIVDLHLTDKRVDLLTENIDLAIRQGPLDDSSLIAERFLTARYRVCASPQYLAQSGTPAKPQDLTQHRCLTFPLAEFNTCWNFRHPDNNKIIPVNLTSPLCINNGMALLACAINGGGIVLLSDWLIQNALNAGSLVDIFPQYDSFATNLEANISFIYPSRTFVPAKVKIVMAYLRQSATAQTNT
ncbi:MAG: LysR family transcriptional regulator [Pseudomonadales bacterium]|nr:LysR family transcriptional regulator [Pseudomonadales bacterium]